MRTLPLFVALLGSTGAFPQSQPAQGPVPERVAGTISSTEGRPLVHATLTLADVRSDETIATTISRDDGHFLFNPVPRGRYRLTGRARGYLPGAYLEHEDYFAAVVTGAGLPLSELNLHLQPASSISGRVLDETGNPPPTDMPNTVEVRLYCKDTSGSFRGIHVCKAASTQDDGSFEFTRLAPGTYFLSVTARPWYAVYPPLGSEDANSSFRSGVDPSLDVAYPIVFYPNAHSSNQAQPLVLKPGDQITANFQLFPEKALVIAIPHSDRAGWTFPYVREKAFDSLEPVNPLLNSVDNVGYIVGLTQGTYVLEDTGGRSSLPTRVREVNLTDQSITLNDAAPVRSSTATLHLRDPEGRPVPKGTLVTLETLDNPPSINLPADAAGEVTFTDIPPGDYRLALPPNLALVRLTVVGRAVPGNQLHVPEAANLAADLTVATPVDLQGTATTDGKPAPGSLVILVPAGGATDPDLFRRDEADTDGRFTLRATVPGNYLLVALENGWSLPWTDTNALEPYLLHAQPIQIKPTPTSTIYLPTPLPTQRVH